MIRNTVKQIFWLISEIFTIIRNTYTLSFWKNLRYNWTCWHKFMSEGYVSIGKPDVDGNVVIETVFYLFGDINVHVQSSLVNPKYAKLISAHIIEMQKFKEQVLYFIPVIISCILHVLVVFFFSFRTVLIILKWFN